MTESEKNPRPYPGEMARQGQIVLTTKFRRTVFVLGLVAAFVIVVGIAVIAVS